MRWWIGVAALVAFTGTATAQATREEEWRACTQPRVAAQAEAIITACTARIDSGIEPPASQAAAFTNRGWAFLARGNAARAVIDQSEALRLNPALSGAHLQRAEARRRMGNHGGAIEDYDAFLLVTPDHSLALIGRGTSRLAMGDPRGALADLGGASRLAPDSALVAHQRGLARAAVGDQAGAMADQTEALRLFPTYAAAFLARARLRAARLDQAGAIDDFGAALRIVPGMADALLGRAEVLVAQGELARAVTDFDQVIQQRPTDRAARLGRGLARTRLGDATGAMADLSEVLRQEPGHVGALRVRIALRMAQRDEAGIIADYTALIAQLPNDAEALRQRGLARSRSGDLAGAVADYTASLRLRPDDAPTLVDRGWARQALSQAAEAIEDYSAAIRIRPDWLAHTNRGMLRAAAGDTRGAFGDYATAQQMAPNQPYAFRFRAELAMRERMFTVAAQDYAVLARLLQTDEDVWVLLGRARLRANSSTGAMIAYEAGLRAGGNRSRLLALRAEALLDKGNAREALADAEAALAADPSNMVAQTWRGRAHAALGQDIHALLYIRTAVDRAPDLAVAWTAMAAASYSAGRVDEALEAAERAVALDPDNAAEALVVLGDIASLFGDEGERVRAHAEAARLDDRFGGVPAARDRAFDRWRSAILLSRGPAPRDAITLFDEAARLAPRDPRIREGRGRAFLAAGDGPNALAAFRAAVAVHATWYPAWDEICRMRGGRGANPVPDACDIADRSEAEESERAEIRGRRQWPAPAR